MADIKKSAFSTSDIRHPASILRSHLLSRFSCLGDKCEDTCCQGWSMQMDEATLARYRQQAPQLLHAVETGADGSPIMRKDPQSGFCVKLEGGQNGSGLCGIHKTHGDAFLGDACYFYPRVTRALGDNIIMTAAMSCPEIARLALADAPPCALEQASAGRLPQSLKNYLPGGVEALDALAVHQAFLEAAEDAQAMPERIFLRIASVSRSLERIGRERWQQAVPFYLAHADERLPAAEPNEADPFNLLHALCGLIVASKKNPSARLKHTVADMEKALAVTLDWDKVDIHATSQSAEAYRRIKTLWDEQCAALYATVLRRWLQMQMALALYPYAGLGNTLPERITIIGVRLATIKLALMCSCSIYGSALPQDIVVRVLQSLSRFLDHLGDAGFSLHIYSETGWTQEKRMRGLLES